MSLAAGQFRRSVQRDNRRRRLFAEENGNGANSVSSVSRGESAGVNQTGYYGDGSFLDEQKRPIDFVPRRLTTFALLLALGLALIAGLEYLHNWQVQLLATIDGGQLAAFDLSRTGCLAGWFSSLLLLATAVAAMLVYTIRRHRTDDYRGRYRIWRWAALCWFLAAADCAANLHDGFKQLMIRLANTNIWGDGSLWWMIPYAFVFIAVGIRLLMDMRPCWLSMTAFLSAGAAYLIAAGMELGMITANDAVRAVMIQSGETMFGHLMLLLSMLLCARYVILDAEGLLPRREPKSSEGSVEKNAKSDPTVADDEWTRVDSPIDTPQPVLRRATSPAPSNSAAARPIFSSSPVSPSPVTRKLTKQEKKALRDKLMRERLERQRR